jgi:hypothetical protein
MSTNAATDPRVVPQGHGVAEQVDAGAVRERDLLLEVPHLGPGRRHLHRQLVGA